MALPSGYKRLKYIRATGGQRINTKFYPKYNTRVVLKISNLNTDDTQQWLFGSRDSGSSVAANQFTLYRNSATSFRSDYFGTNATATVSNVTIETTIDKNANQVSLYGTSITNTAVSSGVCSYPMYIFTLNNAGAAHSNYAMFDCEGAQVWDGDTLVRDYIPCETDADEVGLWDDANDEFYGNEGSGSFTAGPVADPMTPHDGHNANVGNVAREIEGATALVNGVSREIVSGEVLFGGVSRQVNFETEPEIYTVTVTGVNSPYSTAKMDGTSLLVGNTYEVESGTQIVCKVKSDATASTQRAYIYLNDVLLDSYTYTLTVTGNTTIELASRSNALYGWGIIRITME